MNREKARTVIHSASFNEHFGKTEDRLIDIAIDKIYDDFDQQLKTAQSTIEAQEIMLADKDMFLKSMQKHIEELELRLSLSDSALDEYKEQVKYLEAPKSCLTCEYRDVFDPYCKHPKVFSKHTPEYINDVGCNYYEPKDKQ